MNLKNLTVYLTAGLLFLLPLRFGSLAVMPEAGGFFPDDFSEWFFVSNWHPHSLAYFTAPLLILAIIVCGKKRLGSKILLFMLLWCIVPALAVLPGAINGDPTIVQGELSLLLGCAPLFAAAGLLLSEEPEKAQIFISAILLGAVVTAFYGWYQHFVTLPELREYVAMQEANGIPVSDGMKLKLQDYRLFSTMSSSNILAALLMIAVICSFYAGNFFSRFITPPRQGKWAIWIFAGLIFLPMLIMTHSRSALVCPVTAGVLAIFSHPKIKMRWKIAGITGGVVLVAAGILLMAHFRGFGSIGERADYWRSCAILCKDHPLTGAGWGGFFKTHMQIKISDIDESARDPHNVVASFASQCGIPAGLLMLAVLLIPLVILWKHRFTSGIPGIVFWCGVIFTLHSLIDCDWQNPAMICIMGVLYLCAIAADPGRVPEKLPRWGILALFLITAGAGVWFSRSYLAGDYALSRLQDKVNPPNMEMQRKFARIPFEKFYKEAKEERPQAAVIEIYAGDWYARRGLFRKAQEHYWKALELDPVRPAAYARLADLELQMGNREKAEELMNKAHELFPKSKAYTLEALYEKNQ